MRTSQKTSNRVELKSPDARTREGGVAALSKGPTSICALMAVLDDADGFVRNAALEQLLEWDAKRSLPIILRRLRDPFDVHRITALECIAAWGSVGHRRLVVPLLRDSSPTVRAYAAWGSRRVHIHRPLTHDAPVGLRSQCCTRQCSLSLCCSSPQVRQRRPCLPVRRFLAACWMTPRIDRCRCRLRCPENRPLTGCQFSRSPRRQVDATECERVVQFRREHAGDPFFERHERLDLVAVRGLFEHSGRMNSRFRQDLSCSGVNRSAWSRRHRPSALAAGPPGWRA